MPKQRTIPTLILLTASTSLWGQVPAEPLTERERKLLDRLAQMEQRLAAVEKRLAAQSAPPAGTPLAESSGPLSATQAPAAGKPALPESINDTTINGYFDGYYSWNTRRPLGRVNLLRAYDVTANNFAINQTGLVIEKVPNLDTGRRWGYRLDLMYGQATETLQGGAQNEPRPQVYRNIFQAYGTYVIPAGKGLTMDFGKWASSLGFENNYTKDQINYSRSYFFNFLPFYHMGFRTSYNVNDKLSLGYWLVNGGNQTEDFNGFKSQMFQLIAKPTKTAAWTIQYYAGREQRDLVPHLNPGLPSIASQPGLSISPVRPTPGGRFHAIDTYASWNPSEKVTLGGELDYVINRVETNSAPQRIVGGAAYFKYQFTPKVFFGQRYVRLNDSAGLFSGAVQNLNDTTSTLGYRFAEGFETRLEYRRDFSSVPFFLTSEPGRLAKDQNTFTLGLLWWFGGKPGAW